jgi:hypothetical protein
VFASVIISSFILHRKVTTFVAQIKNQISNQMKKLFVIATLVGFSFCVANAQTTPAAAPAQTTPATAPAPAKKETTTKKSTTTKTTTKTASTSTETAPAPAKKGKKGAKKDAGKMEATPAPADKK